MFHNLCNTPHGFHSHKLCWLVFVVGNFLICIFFDYKSYNLISTRIYLKKLSAVQKCGDFNCGLYLYILYSA